jgi:large subunit ribosomal protein L3
LSHTVAKKTKKTLADFEKLLPELSDVRVIACTQPFKVPAVGTKQVDFFEVGLSGKDATEKFATAKELLGKEIPISQVFKEGEFFDAIGVTKGFGWQGVVARFGVALNPRKATKARRHGGSIGAETPAKVMYTVPRAGQSGFHRRTERMKRIYSISNKPTEYSQNACFPNYGRITNDFIVVEGSLSGPAKRVLFLRKLLYENLVKKPEVKEIVKVAM